MNESSVDERDGRGILLERSPTTHQLKTQKMMAQETLSDILETGGGVVEIDAYGADGEGCVEFDDGTIAVAGALPGERVRIELLETGQTAADRLDARLVEVLDSVQERRDPLCKRDDDCRGCQLRHATVVEEMNYKVEAVGDAVETYAELPVEQQPEIERVGPFPLRRGDAHRIRCSLAYRQVGPQEVEVGLVTPVRESLIPMHDCPALTGATRRLVGYIVSTLRELDRPPEAFEPGKASVADAAPGIEGIELTSPTYGRGLVEIRVGGLDGTEAFLSYLHGDRVEAFVEGLVERLPEDVGLSIQAGESRELVKRPERVRLPLAGMRLVAGCGDWLPTTLRPMEALYEYILEILALGVDDRCLDVGCGIGTLTLLAAQQVDSAVGVDINPSSIEAAELNAVEHDVHNVEFMPSGWERALRELALADESFSVATLNPTRTPIGERALAYLGQLGVERLVYVGPSVESAARDLGVLRDKGGRIDHLAAANLDPATASATLVARVSF